MTKCAFLASRYSHPGVTLVEYAILIAFIAILSFAGLKMLGNSTSNLFASSSNKMEADNTLSLLSANSASPGLNSSGSGSGSPGSNGKSGSTGYYKIVVDPATGQPTLQLAKTASGGTNVSSSDGMQKTLGSFMAAETLTSMAASQNDPVAKGYYQKLAELTYYLGGTEGVMDNVDSLQVNESMTIGKKKNATTVEVPYTPQNALGDLMSYQVELQSLISNPPPGVSATVVNRVKPLTNSTLAIAQSYVDANQSFLEETKKDGLQVDSQINEALGADQEVKIIDSGNTGNGKSNGKKPPKKIKAPAVAKPYHELTSFTEMQTIAQQMLNDNQVDSAPVETTLDNGVTIDPTLKTTTP